MENRLIYRQFHPLNGMPLQPMDSKLYGSWEFGSEARQGLRLRTITKDCSGILDERFRISLRQTTWARPIACEIIPLTRTWAARRAWPRRAGSFRGAALS